MRDIEDLKTTFYEHVASQKEINARYGVKIDGLTTQILHLQDANLTAAKIHEQLSMEFREERGQTREAIKSLTVALRDIEEKQTERHDKMIDIQQQNLKANLSLLAIFQRHSEDNRKEFAAVGEKVMTSSMVYKALVGLGLVSLTLGAWFITTMLFPSIDAVVHHGFAAMLEALKHL